jgi:tRNA (cmo5U34)-methyltransferase
MLAPGGLYVTFENIKPDTNDGIGYGLDRWAVFLSSVGQGDEFIKDHRNRFGKAYFPITVCEHLTLLRDTGFAAAELFWFSYMQAGFYAIK